MNSLTNTFITLLLLLGVWSCHSAPDTQPAESAPLAQQDSIKGVKEDYLHTDRVVWQKPELVINLLGDIQDKTIVDIGAGTGFFALRLAPLAQKVIAIDIEPKFVEHLDSLRIATLPAAIQNRLEVRLGAPNNAGLAPQEADVILIVNTYMYITDRVAYLAQLHKSLRSNGRILLVDFKKKITALGPPKDIRIPQYQVEEELERAGYRIVESNDTALDFQYIIVAERTD